MPDDDHEQPYTRRRTPLMFEEQPFTRLIDDNQEAMFLYCERSLISVFERLAGFCGGHKCPICLCGWRKDGRITSFFLS